MSPHGRRVISGLTTINVVDGDLNSFLWLARILTAYYFIYFLGHHAVWMGLRETPLRRCPIPSPRRCCRPPP